MQKEDMVLGVARSLVITVARLSLYNKHCTGLRCLVLPAGACWCMLANTVENTDGLGFTRIVTDPSVYIRKTTKPCGCSCYEMLRIYVDNILILSHEVGYMLKVLVEAF